MRLTLLCGSLVLLAGSALIAVVHVTFDSVVATQSIDVFPLFADQLGQSGNPADVTKQIEVKRRMEATTEALRRDFLDRNTSPLLRNSLATLAGLTTVALLLGWFTAGRLLRPIHQITATARRVADGGLHERISLNRTSDEMTDLADTFDQMLARLEAAFAGQRQFLGNASHELKTPLAINRTLLDVAMSNPTVSADLKQLGRVLLEVNHRQERLIEGLLTLAKSENTVWSPVATDLAILSADAVALVAPEADLLDVSVSCVTTSALVKGDPALLERLVENLVINGVRHNQPGGSVQVSTGHSNGQAVLVVSNTGNEIPAPSIPKLFEPFRRLTDRVDSASGTGLGLAIVRAVAQAHGGVVGATARDGGGLVVEVRLPALDG